MQWPDLLIAIGTYSQQEQADTSFTTTIPTFVSNAELRIYREMDLAGTTGQNRTLQTVAFSKTIDMTTMTGQNVEGTPVLFEYPVVVQGLSALVKNNWVPFQLTSQDFIDMVWPDETQSKAPDVGLAYYTMLDAQSAKIAPVPDAVYPLRVTGTWRPAPMSASNPVTYIGEHFPDMLLCAVMVEIMGYQRDFGAQSDNPQAAMSWAERYEQAKSSAKDEEAARQGLGPGFQPYRPAPLAGPQPNQR